MSDDENKPKKISIVCKKTSTGKASTTIEDSRSYKIVLDVLGYKNKELSISIVAKDSITVEGHAEFLQDERICTKTFTKHYKIPDYVDIFKIKATLTDSGSITLWMPRKDYKDKPEDKPITQPSGESIKVRDMTRKRK